MQPFTRLSARVAPLDRPNVDTDAIMPKQFMKSIRRTGFGDNLFDEWRYLDRGEPGQDIATRTPNPEFVLNQPHRGAAQVLLARQNFGCGSSREHAVWALRDHGIRVVIAPSFADIFYGNCFKNGLLPIVLDASQVEQLFVLAADRPEAWMHVDLETQAVDFDGQLDFRFEIDAERKHRLMLGLDDIALTLQRADRIRAYEARHRAEAPWLFD